MITRLGCAKGVNGVDLATGHLQRRSSLVTQPGLVRNEEKGRQMLKTWSSIESKYLIGLIQGIPSVHQTVSSNDLWTTELREI